MVGEETFCSLARAEVFADLGGAECLTLMPLVFRLETTDAGDAALWRAVEVFISDDSFRVMDRVDGASCAGRTGL